MRKLYLITTLVGFLFLNAVSVFAQKPDEIQQKKKQIEQEFIQQKKLIELQEKQQQEKIEALLKERIPPEKEHELLEFIKERSANEAEYLNQLREKNEIDYFRYLLSINHHQRQLEEIKESDPQRYERHKKMLELDKQTESLVKTFHSKNDEKEKDEIRKKLRKVLMQLFEYRQQQREEEIVRLNEKLKNLRDILDERQGKKDAIVDLRLKKLLGELNHLAW